MSHSAGLAEFGQSRADPLLPVLLDYSVTLMRSQKEQCEAELFSVTWCLITTLLCAGCEPQNSLPGAKLSAWALWGQAGAGALC